MVKSFAKKAVIFLALILTVALGIPDKIYAASDISGHWAENAIVRFQSAGYIKGYPDGTFRPNKFVTRAEFVTIQNSAFGVTGGGAASFKDVKTSDWFYGAVGTAVSNGYVKGYPDNTFKPQKSITRAEAAVMLYSYLGGTPGSSSNFADAGQIPAWAKNAVDFLSAKGYISGYPDGTFKPSKYITRAETVIIMDKAKNGSGDHQPTTYLQDNTDKKTDKDTDGGGRGYSKAGHIYYSDDKHDNSVPVIPNTPDNPNTPDKPNPDEITAVAECDGEPFLTIQQYKVTLTNAVAKDVTDIKAYDKNGSTLNVFYDKEALKTNSTNSFLLRKAAPHNAGDYAVLTVKGKSVKVSLNPYDGSSSSKITAIAECTGEPFLTAQEYKIILTNAVAKDVTNIKAYDKNGSTLSVSYDKSAIKTNGTNSFLIRVKPPHADGDYALIDVNYQTVRVDLPLYVSNKPKATAALEYDKTVLGIESWNVKLTNATAGDVTSFDVKRSGSSIPDLGSNVGEPSKASDSIFHFYSGSGFENGDNVEITLKNGQFINATINK